MKVLSHGVMVSKRHVSAYELQKHYLLTGFRGLLNSCSPSYADIVG